jgi:hypothetical protein
MASPTSKISCTKNYSLFQRSEENRPTNIKKHKRLQQSMKQYGFLKCFPIVCTRNRHGHLIVKDGQHRLAIAETLGVPVWYVVEEVDFDVAIINCTPQAWTLRDYAQKHAANGLAVYQEGLEFAEQHKLPLGTAFSLLGGTTTFTNVQSQFVSGTFVIKDRKWADAVAGIYGPLVVMSPSKHNARLIEACMAVCRVKDFDVRRLLQGAERCREKLVPYSTRDAYLDMLEDIYNFGRHRLIGLKAAAMMEMKKRNFAYGKPTASSQGAGLPGIEKHAAVAIK